MHFELFPPQVRTIVLNFEKRWSTVKVEVKGGDFELQ